MVCNEEWVKYLSPHLTPSFAQSHPSIPPHIHPLPHPLTCHEVCDAQHAPRHIHHVLPLHVGWQRGVRAPREQVAGGEQRREEVRGGGGGGRRVGKQGVDLGGRERGREG